MFKQRAFYLALVGFLMGVISVPSEAQTTQKSAAESQLRAIIELSPDADRARDHLSVILLQTGQRDAALYHARYLSKRAASPELRAQAKRLVERLEGPNWGWRPIFKFVPSSNLNKAATGDTIYVGDQQFSIDPDSRAKDGIGLTFGVSAWRNWRPNEAWRGTIAGEVTATVYPDSDLDARQFLGTTLTFDRTIADSSIAIGLSADATAEKGDVTRLRFGPFVSGRLDVSPKRRHDARFDWLDVRYPNESFRDGNTAGLTLGLTETMSSNAQLRVSLPFTTERTGRPHLDNDGAGLSLRLDKAWASGALRTSFGVAYSEEQYVGVFPGAAMARKDRFTTLSLDISNRNWNILGFTPTIRYEYTVSDSNIPLYDYDSHDIQVTFNKSF